MLSILVAPSSLLYRTSEISILTKAKTTARQNRWGSENPRRYLEDYKPFNSYFELKNVTTQLVKASVLTAAECMLEFSKFEENRVKTDSDEEFDWDAARMKYTPVLIQKTKYAFATSFIRKSYEYIALMELPIRLVDKLTKDLVKSTYRKFKRFSFFGTSGPLFRTAMYNSSLLYLSLWSYDMLAYAFESLSELSNPRKVKSLKSSVKGALRAARWVLQKTALYSACWVAYSVGHSAGALVSPVYVSPILSMLLELGASVAVSAALDIN